MTNPLSQSIEHLRTAQLGVYPFVPQSGLLVSGGKYHLVVESAGLFWTQECDPANFTTVPEFNTGKTVYPLVEEIPWHATVYLKIHPDVSIEQVNGARHHWDDGNYWHFSKHSRQEHQDFELLIADAIAAFFKDEYRDLLISAISTERGDTSAGPGDPVSNKAVALLKLQNFMDFEKQVGESAIKEARLYHLGQILGVHQTIKAALERGVFLSTFTQSTEYTTISTEVDKVVAKIKNAHTYETQAEQAARLRREEAARKAKKGDSNA